MLFAVEMRSDKMWPKLCNSFTRMALERLFCIRKLVSSSKILTVLIFFQSSYCFADSQSLFTQLLQQKQSQEERLEQEKNAPRVQQDELEQRKALLAEKLKELQTQLGEILKQISELDSEIRGIAEAQIAPRQNLIIEDWDLILADLDHTGLCRVKSRDKEGFFQISHKNGETIRFKPFPEANTDLSSFALFTGQVDAPVIEVLQPAYASKKENRSSTMEAKIQYTFKNNALLFGHINFLGERLNDRSFGRSSFRPHRILCQIDFPQKLL